MHSDKSLLEPIAGVNPSGRSLRTGFLRAPIEKLVVEALRPEQRLS